MSGAYSTLISHAPALSVEAGIEIMQKHVDHYASMLEQTGLTDKVEEFRAACEALVDSKRPFRTGYDVPRGYPIEALCWAARGKTEAEHRAFCASMD